MKLFAVGIGGSGGKCLESVIHLHTLGLLHDSKRGPADLGVLFVEPDAQSALLQRAQQALKKTKNLRDKLIGHTRHFCRGQLTDYGVWDPVTSLGNNRTLESIYARQALHAGSAGLGALFDCLYLRDEQVTDLSIGFRGRPPIGSAVMSSQSIDEDSKVWSRFLADVQQAAGNGEDVIIHLFGSVFGGTGAAGVPTLGRMIKRWLNDKEIESCKLGASLLLPYFDFIGTSDQSTGIHAESSTFQLNTDAALQDLSHSGRDIFQQIYILGSDLKTSYPFSTGGVNQSNDSHVLEVLAGLGLQDLARNDNPFDFALAISREQRDKVHWSDFPNHQEFTEALTRGVKFLITWRNNISLDLEQIQDKRISDLFIGAPWLTGYFCEQGEDSLGRKSLNDTHEKAIKLAADQWSDSLLEWLRQICSNTGSELEQELLEATHLKPSKQHVDDIQPVLRGSIKSTQSLDRTEFIKVGLDRLKPRNRNSHGTAGLLDSLWTLC